MISGKGHRGLTWNVEENPSLWAALYEIELSSWAWVVDPTGVRAGKRRIWDAPGNSNYAFKGLWYNLLFLKQQNAVYTKNSTIGIS